MSHAERRFGTGTAVVTGAGAGIGAGFARHLARLGMTVVVADIDEERASLVAEDIRAAGGRADVHGVDVADADAVKRMADNVFDRHGSVELLVNNAGVETAGLLWEVSGARWRRLMEINVDGVFYCLRAFVPLMLKVGKRACVANRSSVGGINSAAVQGPYIVSKFAVLAMTESLHQDLSLVDSPIQVSAVVPHSIRSEIFRAAQRDAPTTNVTANAVFDAMQQANVESGLDPLDAAEHMTEAIARGDFWVFSDDDACRQFTDRRAAQLRDLLPPADPRTMLTRMGIS